ncbi:MAG: ACP S-malonyltransferase, partial [Elusimicrobiota bacterium]|nr:ACP S-malonyltransferase [Elusimicrobiota bacterium]
MINNLAIVFPGQGSQYVGMGKDLYDNFDIVKEYFDIMNNINKDKFAKLSDIIFNGTNEELKQTEVAQIGIYTLSCSIFQILKSKNIVPVFVAGHSLGEYSALTAAETFNFKNGIKLVAKRGEFIKKASQENKGGMIAIIGLDKDNVEKNVKALTKKNIKIEIANYNSPEQIIISYKGDKTTMSEISQYFAQNGAKRS